MEKPLFTLYPSILNALLPDVLRNILVAAIIALGFSSISYILSTAYQASYLRTFLYFWIPFIVILNLRVIWRGVRLWNTAYLFFRHHLVKEFELFKEERFSVMYAKIQNVKTDLSFWDRICNAGDVEIFLKDSHHPSFKLNFVKNPKEIEHRLHFLTRREFAD